MRAICLVASALFSLPAFGETVTRDFIVDLSSLSFSTQSDGTAVAAQVYLPVDPFQFNAVGDQLITTVTFARGDRLVIGSPNEVVQVQYLGGGATKSLQQIELLAASGEIAGATSWTHDQSFTCGNCLSAFTEGDITPTLFSIAGMRVTTTIRDLQSTGAYGTFVFTATGGSIYAQAVPLPGASWLLLSGAGLLGTALRRRTATAATGAV